MPDPIDLYVSSMRKCLEAGQTSERTYRTALAELVQSFDQRVVATSKTGRVRCGAPDYVVIRAQTPLGYMEAKDIGTPLDAAEKTDQIAHFRENLANLVLTDCVEFRWYFEGDHRATARLDERGSKSLVRVGESGKAQLRELMGFFLNPPARTIVSPETLAKKMAQLCVLLRESLRVALRHEPLCGSLHAQMNGFRKGSLGDVTKDQFSDMYAQTVCFGLFTARCLAASGVGFSRQNAAYDLPTAEPFLRTLFGHLAAPDLDDPIDWIVDELAALLGQADITMVLDSIGRRNKGAGPVVHFYETFLAEYNPAMREARGVYYTPEPVVSYIVRSVDYLLTREFGLREGLADSSKAGFTRAVAKNPAAMHRVHILDPATGTGAFLHAVVDKIHESFRDRQHLWPHYVRTDLLPRLWGWEVLMAPYAVAHMKLAQQLRQTGYDLEPDESLRLFLANALELVDGRGMSPPFDRPLAEQSSTEGAVELEAPIMVVLGNPPYSNFGAVNRGEWIRGLLKDYKKGLREKKLNLDDEFIKFMRLGQWLIERAGNGIMAFVTSNTYLDGLTHRVMRESLMKTFSKIFILDLHGSTRKRETSPQGIKDENVFDIRQSVAIGIFVKEPQRKGNTKVYYADLWGSRTQKYARLAESDVSTTKWTELHDRERSCCLGRFRFFTPKSFDYADEYCAGWSVKDIFPHNAGGIETQRDRVTIHYDAESLIRLLTSLQSDPVERFRTLSRVGPDAHDWTVERAKECVSRVDLGELTPHRILYRPFDVRYTWLNPESKGFIAYPRYGITRHMLAGNNLALCTTHHVREDWNRHVLAAHTFAGKDAVSSLDRCFMFPLYLSPADHEDFFLRSDALKDVMHWVDKIPRVLTGQVDVPSEVARTRESIRNLFPRKVRRWVNIHPVFIQEMVESLGLSFTPHGTGDLVTSFGPEDIFHYLYAFFHCPTYADRYREFLKIDFPRAQVTSDLSLFRSLCRLGRELVDLHTMTKEAAVRTTYPIHGDDRVERVRYAEPGQGEEQGRVWINRSQYFEGIPSDVWHFRVGGYQVCNKWLKERRRRTLSYEDLSHFHQMVAAIAETISLMQRIDTVVDQGGGLPLRRRVPM